MTAPIISKSTIDLVPFLDSALSSMLKQIARAPRANEEPLTWADKCRIVNAAINHEKMKHQITDKDKEFDPTTFDN